MEPMKSAIRRTVLYLLRGILLLAVLTEPVLAKGYDHAAVQLLEFVQSRPAAGAIMDRTAEYYTFLGRAFAGVYTSVPLFWDESAPQGNAYAENTPNDLRTGIIIRVSSKLNAYDQLAALIYECMNAQNEEYFSEFIHEAYLGSLDKTEFIHGILRLEHKKLKETRAFLAPQKPFDTLDISQTDFYRKMVETPDDFEGFLAYLHEVKRPDYDVFDMYSRFYDFITASPQRRKAELDAQARAKAEKAAEAKRAEAAGEQENDKK